MPVQAFETIDLSQLPAFFQTCNLAGGGTAFNFEVVVFCQRSKHIPAFGHFVTQPIDGAEPFQSPDPNCSDISEMHHNTN